ncbi:MAG: FAD-dependent oxidoreductase [Saprospiraceae bacterium]|nr:FAD-dependent oxidoreductase [Saprospiraceae bacterium]
MKKYDVIVIGAGSAGLGSAGVAHTIGLKTLLIEKDADHFGGDCTNFGCVPSKALIHIAHHFHSAQQAEQFGLQSSGKADMKKVLAYIHAKQAIIRNTEDAPALRQHGQEVLIGHARFVNDTTIEVDGERFSSKVFLLCTGSSPRTLRIEGMEHTRMYTNESLFTECDHLPEHFIIIGGGPIGCEMAQAFQRLGSQVYLINRGDHLLRKEPKKVSKILQQRFKSEGIELYNNAEVVHFEKDRVVIKKDGRRISLPQNAALMAIGRLANTKNLGLEEAGIQLTTEGKIKVDSYLRSSNSRAYVLGDAAGSYMFSHGAEKMVRQLWRNLLVPIFQKKNTLEDLSWVTFTDPQVAHFGYTEKELTTRNLAYHRQDQSFSHDDRAIIQEYTDAHMSLWLDQKHSIGKRIIRSGSMIAPQAGELIQEMQLAKHASIPIQAITNRVYPYPVASRINQKTLRGQMDQTYKPWKKKLARLSFRMFN